MMMMLTTQLTYTPTPSAVAGRCGKPPVEAPKSAAIGLVETGLQADAFENRMAVPVGTTSARSGKVVFFGMIGVALATAFVTALFTNPEFKETVFQLISSITGGNRKKSSHRSNEKLGDEEETGAKNNIVPFNRRKATVEEEEAYA